MKLTDFDALTFDCYGTLIDWESGMINGLQPLITRLDTELTRNEILEMHAFFESTTQKFAPSKLYPDLLAVVYKRFSEEWKLPVTWAECQNYGQSVEHWPAFPDSAEALVYLKQHYKLVILSNVDNASLEHSVKKLGVEFDAKYTAEDIGSYKPAVRNFEYMVQHMERLGVPKDRILHTSESLFHDHGPANDVEVVNCRINRRMHEEGFGATMGPVRKILDSTYLFEFETMGAMAEAHKEELASV